MKIRIKMFSDYICPFCYLGKAIIDKLKNRFDIELEHIGIEIHPETPISGVDLRKWFKNIVGDEKIAKRIDHIKAGIQDEELGKKLSKTVQNRIAELQQHP